MLSDTRPLLTFALTGELESMETALFEEERIERAADRKYWEPLKAELTALRQTEPMTAEDV